MTNCTCHPGHTCTSVESCAAARRAEFGDVADYKSIREALAAGPSEWMADRYGTLRDQNNETVRLNGVSLPCGHVPANDISHTNTAYMLACNPSAIRALLADLDAMRADAQRYRLLRRGQHWSVVDGVGDILRADELDTRIDAALKGAAHE